MSKPVTHITPEVKERDMKRPSVPDNINAALMTDDGLKSKLQQGLDDAKARKVYDAADVVAQFKKEHAI